MGRNREIFIFHLYLLTPQGVIDPVGISRRCLIDIHKTRMIRLSCGEETMTMFSCFDRIGYRNVTDRTNRQTDGQT